MRDAVAEPLDGAATILHAASRRILSECKGYLARHVAGAAWIGGRDCHWPPTVAPRGGVPCSAASHGSEVERHAQPQATGNQRTRSETDRMGAVNDG